MYQTSIIHTQKDESVRKCNGVVYTPVSLAKYVARKILDYYFKEQSSSELNKIQRMKVLDPACGEGALLMPAWDAIQSYCLSKHHQTSQINPRSILCGIDIDSSSVETVKKAIIRTSKLNQHEGEFNLIHTNALAPFNSQATRLGWQKILKKFESPNGVDVLIANPPWGADISSYRKLLDKNYSLLKGQSDSSDLFVEMALSIVKPGGYFAFIIPDSLFGQERVPLRKMLLERTEIKFIGRFGEKIFENVNRACAVIICKNEKAHPINQVKCFRLTSEFRRNIILGNIDFEVAEGKLAHSVPQERFQKNRDFIFDIDSKENEQVTLFRINTTKNTFGRYLSSTRGVELSKKGEVVQCKSCRFWFPKPHSTTLSCPHCKKLVDLNLLKRDKIISIKRERGRLPLLVGESIRRYKINDVLWIDSNREGISYKEQDIYKGPKILVRKTGVGITASMDYSNAFTNQVVYIFRKKEDAPLDLPLEFFLAIMNSRAIYYYLVKSHGEMEWRSHPYLSQGQVLGLPLPKVDFMAGDNLKRTQEVSDLIRPYLIKREDISDLIDARVERSIAKFFGLTRANYEFIYKALADAEGLLPVRALKNISISDIFNS